MSHLSLLMCLPYFDKHYSPAERVPNEIWIMIMNMMDTEDSVNLGIALAMKNYHPFSKVRKCPGLCYLKALYPGWALEGMRRSGFMPKTIDFFIMMSKVSSFPKFKLRTSYLTDIYHVTLEDEWGIGTSDIYPWSTDEIATWTVEYWVSPGRSEKVMLSSDHYYGGGMNGFSDCEIINIDIDFKYDNTRVGADTLELMTYAGRVVNGDLEIPPLNQYTFSDITLCRNNVSVRHAPPKCGLLTPREKSRVQSITDHVHLEIVSGESKETFCEYNDSLRQIRHNVVAGYLKGGTDMPLGTLIGNLEGIEKDLSPDFIDVGESIVAELGTTLKTTSGGLEDEALDKINKYKYILDRLPSYEFYVMIVGRLGVVSNLLLDSRQVNLLVSRFRVGRELEALVTESLGRDIFHEHSSRDQLLARSSLCQTFPVLESQGFPKTMKEIINPLSDGEKAHVSGILAESLERTGKTPDYPKVDKYLSSFRMENCRTDMKRITIFPIVRSDKKDLTLELDPESANSLPNDLKSIWIQSKAVVTEKRTLSEQVCESIGLKEYERHIVKKQSRFTAVLSSEDKIMSAESGIMGKVNKKEESVMKKYGHSKKSFHPTSKTHDISDFCKSSVWHHDTKGTSVNSVIMELINSAKKDKQIKNYESVPIFKSITQKEIIWLSSIISEIVLEISYTYKHYSNGYQFYHKISPSGIHLIIKPTKTHIFFSIGYPKRYFQSGDPGRIGPGLHESQNYIFSEWSSINEVGIDHFVKTGPYMASVYMFFSELGKSNPGELTDHYQEVFNNVFLLHLNNKLDAEELVTSQRYLWMRSMEEIKPNPDFFVERLPEVMRSRLTVYLLKRTLHCMEMLRNEPVIKSPQVVDDKTAIMDFLNIRSLFNGAKITISEKINEFYFGYVITKARGADSSFKIVKKILKEEYRATDLQAKAITLLTKPSLYESDEGYLKFIAQRMRQKLIDQLGDNFEAVMLQDILRNAANSSFEEISTLKASARDHSSDLIIDDELIGQETWLINAAIRKNNKKEAEKRPKVIVALKDLVEIFETEHGRKPFHLVEMAPWCLRRLLAKGYIDSDIFSKPQHGGVREIHVLEVSARIVQYYGEMISYQLCSYFPSETTCNPDTKKTFVSNHYSNTQNFKNPVTFCKSADATKWCQRHDVVTFAYLAAYTVPEALHNFLLSTFSLWPHKRLNFPIELAANFIANKDVKSDPVYERLRHEFYTGTGAVCGARNNKIKVTRGMWQGIWHRWSSYKQGSNMEPHKDLVEAYLADKGIKHKMSIIYGSDDSGALLTLEGGYTKKNVSLAHRLLFWKEKMADYASINNSEAKTTISACEIFEYNSEWFICGKPLKPTFRWVSAAMAMTTTHRFIDRFRTMYNSIKDCIEGGCSTFTSSIIQLCQAWLHYMMMGFSTSDLRNLVSKFLLKVVDPALGYFLMDFDFCAGVPGYDYNLYIHSKTSKYRHYLPELDEDDPQNMYTYEGQKIKTVSRDLRGVRLRHGRLSLWESVRDKFDIKSAEDAILAFDRDPLLLFGRHVSWEESYPHLVVKIFAPGVKESLSTYSSLARTATSSMYLFSRPCLTINGSTEKVSLLRALMMKKSRYTSNPDGVRRFFPYWRQYDQIEKDLHTLKDSVMTEIAMKPRGKVTLTIIEAEVYSMPVLEMCKRQWWGIGKVALSNRQMPRFWKMTKDEYPFLRESAEETCLHLGICMLELKNLLEGLSLKGRRITLFDTAGRSGSLSYTMSRVFWPNVKLQFSALETSLTTLKSELTTACSFFSNKSEKKMEVMSRITSHIELKNPFSVIPEHSKSLKLIHDWANGMSRHDILSVLTNMKKGVFGIFIQRQNYDYNMRGKRNKYTGKGVWIGRVASVDCRIHLEDDTCKIIEVKQTVNSRELGKGLSDLMKSFKVETTMASDIQTKFRLTPSGLIRTRSADDGAFPLSINPNIEVDVLAGIEGQVWDIEIVPHSIRLVAKSREDDLPYTIISQSIKMSDWDPDCGYFTNYALSTWNKLEPLPLSEFERILQDVPSDESFSSYWKKLKKGEISCEWDLLYLSNVLKRVFKGNVIDLTSNDDSDISSIDEEVVLQTLRAINLYDPKEEDFEWSKDVIDSDYSGIDFISQSNDEIIEQTAELLKSMMLTGQNLLYSDTQYRGALMSRRRFFEQIISLGNIISDGKFEEGIYDRSLIITSPLIRKLLMIMDGKYDDMLGPSQEDELSEFLSQSASTFNGDTIEELTRRLDDITHAIPHLKGYALMSMERAKNKIETKLRTLQGLETYHRLDIIGSTFWHSLPQLLVLLGVNKYENRSKSIEIQSAIIKIDVAIAIQKELEIDNISSQEAQEENQSLFRDIVSSKILLIICALFDITFYVDENEYGSGRNKFQLKSSGTISELENVGF